MFSIYVSVTLVSFHIIESEHDSAITLFEWRSIRLEHKAKKRLYAEKALINCGSRRQLQVIELFSKIHLNLSRIVLSYVLTLSCCHSKCSYGNGCRGRFEKLRLRIFCLHLHIAPRTWVELFDICIFIIKVEYHTFFTFLCFKVKLNSYFYFLLVYFLFL